MSAGGWRLLAVTSSAAYTDFKLKNMKKIHLKNLLATAKNLVGVIENKQWERLSSKTQDLKDAIKMTEPEVVFSGPVLVGPAGCPKCTKRPIDLGPQELVFGLKQVCGKCGYVLREGKLTA